MEAKDRNSMQEENSSTVTNVDGIVRKKVESRKSLKKKLKNAENETDDLRKIIEGKDKQIEELTQNLNYLNKVNSQNEEKFGKETIAASGQISKVSKKSDELSAELEALKLQYATLQDKCAKLEASTKTDPVPVKKVPCCNSASKVNSLTEQLAATKQKLFETLNQISELKNNLKLVQKCLQHEIGEHVNVPILSGTGSSWRGRAQQIISLQNKVAELKERLEISSLGDEPIKQQFRKFELKKNAEIEHLTQKIVELNSLSEDQKKKIVALKNRNKSLCDDAMNYKLKTLNIMEKTGGSDQTFTVLQEKINIQKYQYENQMIDLRKEIENMDELLKQAKREHRQTKTQLENFEYIILEKDETIAELENNLRAISGDFLFSCREFKKEEFVAILDALEHEKQSLMKHIAELNDRNNEERNKVHNLTDQLAKQRVKYCRLDTKYRDMLKEQETQHDKKRRSQRAADYARSLNGSLSTLVFENSRQTIMETQTLANTSYLQTDDLKNKLELANERIVCLEEKLLMVSKEHANDFNTFNGIINSSKNVIVQMLLENRESGCNLHTSDSPIEIVSKQDDFETDSLEEVNH